jgi:hypothetical protein
MDYAFAHNLDFQGGQYGVAILVAILAQERRASDVLLTSVKQKRRGMLRVEIEVDGKVIN